MSFRAYYELNCNGAKCSNAYPAPIETLHHALLMEEAALAEGWSKPPRTKGQRGGQHLCATCTPKGQTQTDDGL